MVLLSLNCPLVGIFLTNSFKLFNTPTVNPKCDLFPAHIKSPFVDKLCLLPLKGLFNYAPESDLSSGQPTNPFQSILDTLGIITQQATVLIQIAKQMVPSKKKPLAICLKCVIKEGFFEGKLHYCLKKNPYSNYNYCQEQHNTYDQVGAPKHNVFKTNFKTDLESTVAIRLPAQCLY